jgi:hypothetical protein
MIVLNAILEAQKEKQRARYRKWYATTAGKAKAIENASAWKAANPEKVKASQQKHRQANGDAIKERKRKLAQTDGQKQKRRQYRKRKLLDIRLYARERGRKEDVKRKKRDQMLWSNYRITLIQYEEMVDRQGGVCAVCCDAKATDVDHCHTTGVVRGILCHACNKGLGYFRDNPEKLAAAIAYLCPPPPPPPEAVSEPASPPDGQGGGEAPEQPQPMPPEMQP